MRRTKQLNRHHKRMILDFAGVQSVKLQPKSMGEINVMHDLFQSTEPERYAAAYKVIVNHEAPDGDNSAIIAGKVSELVEMNLEYQQSNSVNEITSHFLSKEVELSEAIAEEARNAIEKAREEFKIIKVKIGGRKSREIKGIVCEQFERLLQLAQQRVNIMMVGPAGCGKTHIASQIADALELDYASQSCSAGMSESQLTGWLLPIKKGNFEYVSSEFVRIYENGGVFLFDEMDAADPNVLIFVNQALANGQFSLPQRFENTTVRKHKNFVAVAATNTFGGGADAMYHARNALDAATLDRFRIGMTAIDYSETVEAALVEESVLSWGVKVRKVISTHGMRKIMSTRVMKDATSMMKGQDWSIAEISKSYFSDWSKEEIELMKREFPEYNGAKRMGLNGDECDLAPFDAKEEKLIIGGGRHGGRKWIR